jgi:hypothetical protein
VSFGRADHDDLGRMAGHLATDTAGALGRRREISARRRAAQRELEAAEQRLADAEERAGHAVGFAEVSATVEASAATARRWSFLIIGESPLAGRREAGLIPDESRLRTVGEGSRHVDGVACVGVWVLVR